MGCTIVQEVRQEVLERLTPAITDRLGPNDTTTGTAWPFLPKGPSMKSSPPASSTATPSCTPRRPPTNPRSTLLRSSSFVKIRKYCKQSCDAFLLLNASRTTLQASVGHAVVQLKECMLVLSVYLCCTLLLLQLTACLYALAGKPPPPGLIFMVVCLFAIMANFTHIVVSVVSTRKSRSTRRRVVFAVKKDN